MIERPAGAVNAALMPLMKRVAMSSVPSSARPPSAEATTKTPRENSVEEDRAAEHEQHAPGALAQLLDAPGSTRGA
jgi:hypothetical protein